MITGAHPLPATDRRYRVAYPGAVQADASSLDLAIRTPITRRTNATLVLPQAAPLAKPRPNALQRAATALAPALPYLAAAGTVACLMGAAQGYPCTRFGDKDDQNFINANKTLFGVIHGWFSNCEDCTYQCGQTCSNNVCTPTYCTQAEQDKPPSHYVNAAAALVEQCGFTLVNSIPGNAAVRIANALIERQLWVKVAVNALNLTDVTDPSILCLHGIAK